MGYLGKISAIVSVNTGDFAAKLNRLKGDVGSFADSTMRSMANASRSSAKSFGSIYTEVQKLERALRAASTMKLDFTGLKGFEGKGLQEAVDQMRQMHSIASQLSAPLSKAVTSVDAMSDAVKSRLSPAMVQAQAAVEALQTEIAQTGKVSGDAFDAATKKVRTFADAAKVASEASQAAASMGGGKTFQFQFPKLRESMDKGGDLYRQAGALPAERMTRELTKLVTAQKQAATTAASMAAAYSAMPTAANKTAFDAAATALDGVNSRIQGIIQSYGDMDAAATQAALVAANVGAKTEYSSDITGIMAFRQREAEAKQAALVAANVGAKTEYSSDITGIMAFRKREADAKQAALVAGNVGAKTEYSSDITGLLAFRQREAAAKQAAADKAAADAKAKSDATSLLRLEQSRLQVMTGEAQSVSQLASQYAGVLSRVEKLSAAQKASVAATIAANAGMVEYAISSGTDADVSGVLAEVKAIESAVDAAEDLDAKQKAAKKSADDLLGLQQGYAQSLSGQSQNIAQLRSTYDGLISRFEKLSAAQRATLAAGGFSISADKVQQTLSSGDESKVAGTQASIAAMEAAVSGAEDLDVKQKAAKKSSDDLRDSLSKIGDSIGTPAAPIDRAREAIDRMNAAIEKIKDPAAKAKAAAAAAAIRKDIETEVAISAATGSAPAGSVVSGAAAKATSLADATEAMNKRKTATDLFGPAIGSSERKIDGLKTKVVALHGEFDKLSQPLQKLLGGAMTKLRDDLANLTPASSAAEVKKVATEYGKLEQYIKRLNQSASFKGSFGDFLNDSSVKYFQAQLQTVQTQMAAVGAEAKGPVADAIKKYRSELSAAARAGTLGTDATRQKMKGLVQDIANAAVESGKLSKAQAKAFVGGVMRSGDIGRGGADKAALALNQAAYAVDDFMSSTGGVEQKIRAISNNVSQLGFVLGGTKGLFLALGVTIAAQASVAIYKFISGGKTAEDTTKALNDALASQKTAVEALSGVYKDLAKSMIVSATAQRGAENSGVLGGLADGNYKNRMARLTGVNSTVVSERASSAAIQRAMESSGITSSVGVGLYRTELLKQSKMRERTAEGAVRRSAPGNVQDLEAMRARRAGIVATLSDNDRAKAYEALGIDPRFNKQFDQLTSELESLEQSIRSAEVVIEDWADGLSMAAVAAAQTAKLRIEAASNLLASAVESGVPGARTFQNQIDAVASELSGALTDLAAASEQTGERRGSEAMNAQGRIRAAFDKTADLIAETLNYRIKAAFSQPGAKDLLGQMNERRFAGSRSSLVGAAARMDVAQAQMGIRNTQAATAAAELNRIRSEGRRRVGDAEQDLANAQRATSVEGDEEGRKRIEAAVESARNEVEAQKAAANAANKAAEADLASAEASRAVAQADYEAADKVSRLAAAAAQAAIDIDQFLGRTRKIGEGGLSASEQSADIRQQMFMRRPTEANRAARDEAERQLIVDRERVARANSQLDQRRAQAEMDPVVLKANDLIAGAQEELARLQAEAATNGGAVDPARVRQLQDVEAAARADRDRRVFDMTGKEREAQEQAAREMEGRRKQAEMDQRAGESKAAERDRVRQGREDAMTSRERRVLEASRSSENMAAAAGEFADPVARTAFIQKYFDNQKKEILQSGPLGQAADERYNAQFTTRRVGMEATDASTMEGSRELNRLLRGDDANKDVNFAEMQRQTELLSDIRDGIIASTGTPVIP
jgi:hypothetical protein